MRAPLLPFLTRSALLLAMASCAEDVRIVRGPYVEVMGPDEAAVSWVTEKPGDSRVAFGLTASYGEEVTDGAIVTEHRMLMGGLSPGKTYYYRVASAGSEVQATFVAGVRFQRSPYTQYVTETAATVTWGPLSTSGAVVLLETQDGVLVSDDQGVGRVRFTRLTPGTDYRYRVVAHGVSAPQGAFRTSASSDSTFSFAFYGDSRQNPAGHGRVVEQMLNHQFDFVIHSGDFVGDGRVEAEWIPQFFEPTRALRLRAPIYPAIGNHEQDSRFYYDYFEVPPNGSSERPEAWYAFDYGQAHFAVLDTNPESGSLDTGSEQRTWLEADLAGSQARWKFVVVHHPAYSSGYHKSNLRIRKNLVPLCERFGVDMVLTGHEHCYERTWPLQQDRRVDRGMVQVVSGGGGAPLYSVGRSDWTAVSESVAHFCMVSINGGQLDLDVYDIEGNAIDAFTLYKDETHVKTLASQLDGSAAERRIAIEALGRTGMREVPSWVRPYATSADGATRTAVAEAIARAGTAEGVDVLEKLLTDERVAVRRWAVWGMGIAGTNRGLKAALNDGDAEVRWMAAKGLQLSPDQTAVPALANALDDTEPTVRLAVVRTLVAHERAEAPLIRAILDEDPEVRGAAIRGSIERRVMVKAAPSIARVVDELDGKLLIEAIEALGLSGDHSIVPALVTKLNHEVVKVRRAAVIGLGRLKADTGVAGLIGALEDIDSGVRVLALRALRTTTKERFGDDADVWRRWLAEN